MLFAQEILDSKREKEELVEIKPRIKLKEKKRIVIDAEQETQQEIKKM